MNIVIATISQYHILPVNYNIKYKKDYEISPNVRINSM